MCACRASSFSLVLRCDALDGAELLPPTPPESLRLLLLSTDPLFATPSGLILRLSVFPRAIHLRRMRLVIRDPPDEVGLARPTFGFLCQLRYIREARAAGKGQLAQLSRSASV